MREKSFEEIAEECHKDRLEEEYNQRNSFDNQARKEYALFCCWCRAFKNTKFTENNFKEYLKKEKPDINFWIKKRIAELFFGYVFQYNNKTYKWERKKIVNVS